ncbi:PilZ domain-containing protein [Halobacteriovorax sp. XZX-3]|uniref:PilZ domain-containing protein n=1 Tax=unclassified Halobacteriovorax TaxID=2639665 RepID=UPI000CD111A4|nr:PilZ domain-containing protein [Halobacteriovorax sp. DA5]POB12653.1 hypothetical protein C0Z22_14300 [Halobacteriovorax sp. DA5]
MDANKKFYFSEIPFEEKISFLKRALSDGLIIEIWRKGQEKDKVESFKIKSFDESELEFTLDFDASLIAKLAGSKNKDNEVLLKIKFKSVILFSSSYLSFIAAEEVYKLKVDRPVYKSQQRSNYRLHANAYIPIQIKIEEDVFDCNDISAGGISFNCPKDFADKFKKESIFDNATVRLASKRFEIPQVKIAATWPIENNEETPMGIGIAFMNMDKEVEEDLVLSINSEARGEELRKQAAMKKGT